MSCCMSRQPYLACNLRHISVINPYLYVLSGLDTYFLRDAFDCYTFKYPTNDNLIFRSITYYRLKLSQFKIFKPIGLFSISFVSKPNRRPMTLEWNWTGDKRNLANPYPDIFFHRKEDGIHCCNCMCSSLACCDSFDRIQLELWSCLGFSQTQDCIRLRLKEKPVYYSWSTHIFVISKDVSEMPSELPRKFCCWKEKIQEAPLKTTRFSTVYLPELNISVC